MKAVKAKYLWATAASLITFIFYYINLAPGLTLEDSGEFIAALVSRGVPHPPGYPLYMLLAGPFVRLFAESPAFGANLFSALTSALSVGVFFLVLIEFSQSILPNKIFSWLENSLLFSLCVFVASRPHVIRQSLITEVYGLHQLLTVLVLYFFLKWIRNPTSPKNKFFTAFFCGLALSNHHIFLTIGLGILITIVLVDFKFFKDLKTLTKASVAFFIGLLPYLYIPWASSKNPLLNWGNINSWNGFLVHLNRQQYIPTINRTWLEFVEQIREYLLQLLYNVEAPFLFLVMLGLLISISSKSLLRWVGLILIFCSGPLVAFIVNFKIAVVQQYAYLEISNISSVFFLTQYYILAILILYPLLYFLESFLNSKVKYLTLVLSAGIFYSAHIHLTTESKSKFLFAQDLVENISIASNGQKTVVLSNWDPFSFPGIYYSVVEKKYPNLIFVDTEMLKASWYNQSLKRWYPELIEFFEGADIALNEYFDKYALFGDQESGKFIISHYHQLGRNIVFNALKNNYRVISTVSDDFVPLAPQLIEGLTKHHIGVGYEILRSTDTPSKIVDPNKMKLNGFESDSFVNDRLSKMLGSYYSLSLLRGVDFELQKGPLDPTTRQTLQEIALSAKKIGRWDTNVQKYFEDLYIKLK